MIRATEVLPVPGGPRKTKCCMGLSVWYPACARLRAASTDAASWRIWPLTPSRPIIASSSAIAWSMVIVGRSRSAPGCSGTPTATCCIRAPSVSRTTLTGPAGERPPRPVTAGGPLRPAVSPCGPVADGLRAGCLPAPGEAPGQYDDGEQPPDHVAEDGLAGGEPPGEHGGRHRPQQRPGHGPAGHEVAGQRARKGGG